MKEDNILKGIIIDKIKAHKKTNKIIFTDFLDLNQFKIVSSILNQENVNYSIYDYNSLLERKIIIIHKKNTIISNYPIACLEIRNDSNNELLHKDYMGAIYNSGIQSCLIGDIFIEENKAIVFIISKITNYLLDNITTIGNNKVSIDILEEKNIKISKKFETTTITAASIRIDVVLSKIYKLSRNQVNDLIKSNKLIINSINYKNNSYNLKNNDIVSLRTYGKFQYIEYKKNKKDKLIITINKYN